MAYREFHDSQGKQWEAWEVHPSAVERRMNREDVQLDRDSADRRQRSQARFAVPPRLKEGWLALQAVDERRRIAPIPTNWTTLSEVELAQLIAESEALPVRQAPRVK